MRRILFFTAAAAAASFWLLRKRTPDPDLGDSLPVPPPAQTDDLVEKIEQKTAYKAVIQTTVEENKSGASEARKLEQECGKKQESLVPLEQPARQKVTEITNGRLGDLGSIDEETEYRAKLAEVRTELEPLENELIEHKGKLDVACAESKLLKEKHNAGRAAYEDAQRQTDDPDEKIENKGAYKAEIETEIEENKSDASEARQVEHECGKKQESLVPLEQPSRQKVTEITNGRLGDLGSIDGFREFRIVRDNRAINSDAKPETPQLQAYGSQQAQITAPVKNSAMVLTKQKQSNATNPKRYTQGVKGLHVAGPPGVKNPGLNGSKKPSLPEGSHVQYPGLYRRTQPDSIPNTRYMVHQQVDPGFGQGVGVRVGDAGPGQMDRSLFVISADFNTGFSSYNPSKRLLLDSCNFCRKRLDKKRDIFMYRGDTPFCSEECRQVQIEIDEAMEKNQNHRLSSLLRKKIVTLASDYCWIPSTSHYKPVPAGTSAGYGNFTYPAGFTINAPASTGADIWIQTPREVPGLQSAHPTFMPTHMPAHAGLGSFNASAQSSHVQYPGLYHRTQPGLIPNTHYMVHQQVAPGFGQGVGVGVAGPGPQVGTYQQPQATRIAYSADKEFRHVVTLDGALFEKPGTMGGGGGRPRGGRMGTCIKENVSVEAVVDANEEHANLEEQMKSIRQKISDAMRRWLRQKISDAMRRYQASEKVEAHLEMELAKCQEEIDSMNAEHNYLEKQLDSLKNDELSKLKELDSTISSEQKELDRLTKCSSKLRQKDTEIKRHKVKMASGQRMLERLTRGIEESKKEKEKLVAEKEKITSAFNNIRQETLTVQEKYMKTEELIDAPNDVVDKTKADKLKKTMDELGVAQNYVEYKLHSLKNFARKWEKKVHTQNKKLDDVRLDMLLVHPYSDILDRLLAV